MIDRVNRNKLAQGMRDFLSGRIDNLAFDDLDLDQQVTCSDDQALFEVFYAVWPNYDDFVSHPLELSDGGRLDFKRSMIFLHSNYEYEWSRATPTGPGWLERFVAKLTGRRLEREPHPAAGDFGVWPFFRRSDYEQALASPRLFNGGARQCQLSG